MASQIQTYQVTEGDQTLTVERGGAPGTWYIHGGVIDVLQQNGHTALAQRSFDSAEAAQTAASAILVALNDFLTTSDDLAA